MGTAAVDPVILPSEDLEPLEALKWAFDRFHPRIVLACSFQAEAIVIIDLAKRVRDDVRVFSLDTGRLHEETYEVAEAVNRRYGIAIEWVHPDAEAVEGLMRAKGVYSFRESVENRKECCRIRKVDPLKRVLSTVDAWVTGLRREQSESRGHTSQFQWDKGHGNIVKVNPLVHWTVRDVWQHIRENELPYNRLYDRGYQQIGCAPCTRSVRPGEEARAGRWWWEEPEHKECGLHIGGSGI